MVDPVNFTDYGRSLEQLEEALIFCVLVAGKKALTTSRALDKLLTSIQSGKPFESFRKFSEKELQTLLMMHGIGCHTAKAKSIYQLVRAELDLKKCGLFDLIKIYGIKFKTANFFLMHTRENYVAACLDTHILKHLAALGHKVPKSTPQSKKSYDRIQKIFLDLCETEGKKPADLDLELWRKYSGNAAY